MKRLCPTLSALSVLTMTIMGLAGCDSSPPVDPGIDTTAAQQRSMDMWFVNTQQDNAVSRGVIAQRTIFAYHFDSGSARLTDLGKRDLAILAEYYKSTPGELTLTREGASDGLYAARTTTVRTALKDAGLNDESVQIVDGSPSGRGVYGREIVDAHEVEKKSTKSTSATNSGAYISGSSESASSGSSSESMKGSSK